MDSYWARQTLFGRSRPWTRQGGDGESEEGEQGPPEMWEVWMDRPSYTTAKEEKMDKVSRAFACLVERDEVR